MPEPIPPGSHELTVIEIPFGFYQAALTRVGELGLVSGVVYDALHLGCAEEAGCHRLSTYNLRDDERLQPVGVTLAVP